MTVTVTWRDERERRSIECERLSDVLAEAAAEATEPVVVVIEAAGAALHVVVGDTTGTVLLYYPPEYEHRGVGSLHSVGDTEAAALDRWETPLTAYYFGHHSEFARWSVVAHEVGALAAQQFCERPPGPPPSVSWEVD